MREKTGLDPEEIKLIFNLCKVDLANFHGRKRHRSAGSGQVAKCFMSRHNLLLLALNSLWKNPTEVELSIEFGTPQQTISEARKRLFPILQRCLAHFVAFPTKVPQKFASGPLKNAIILVDTTPTPVPRPQSSNDQRQYYNYKKKPTKFAIKTQAAVGLDLKIWDVSASYPCSVHDRTIFQQSAVIGKLAPNKLALGDRGYLAEPNFIVPFRKPPRRALTQAQKLFNKQHSHVRVAVENVFKRVKDFKIISGVYRGDIHALNEFNIIFKLVCSLTNLHFEHHPLYAYPARVLKLPKA